MDSKPINFVSKIKIEHDRKVTKDARECLLSAAEEKFRKREKIESQRKERGEDKWLLPSVEDRLSSKKSKKKKKEKKKKKKKHKKKYEESDSESDSEEHKWVEASEKSENKFDKTEREDWMVLPPSLFPSMSRKEIKQRELAKSQSKSEEETKKTNTLDALGQSSRELNPYWKNGGTGLPTEKPEKTKRVVGDGGLSWLRRAYKRAQQQSEEQGKSLEEVAAERFGSLAKLEELISEAEDKFSSNKQQLYESKIHQRVSTNQSKYRHSDRTDYPTHENSSKDKRKFAKPDYDESNSKANVNLSLSHRGSSNDKHARKSSSMGWKKTETKESDAIKSFNKKENIVESEDSRKEMDSSSSDESDSRVEEQVVVMPPKLLTDKEMNALGARILKCELMGDKVLAEKLKSELEAARMLKAEAPKNDQNSDKEETVVLTRTDSRGVTRPLTDGGQHKGEASHHRRKKQKVETHDKSGDRVRYFADDDNFSLKEMFEREKLGTTEDQNSMLSRLAGKGMETNDDMDEIMISRADRKQSEARLREQDRSKAIFEHKKKTAALENCWFCFEGKNIQKHMIIAIGIKAYLCLPARQSLTEGHCLIVPMQHVTCATQLDEDIWSEIQIFRKGLTKLFEDQEKVPVFFETNLHPKKFPHMVIECVPMEKEIGDMAPIYFKKAIMESEREWSQNKKLVELKNRDVRKAIPAGLPYFSVDFGLENGFAHVIEEEKEFPSYFAGEIIGGMLDLEPRLWRNPMWEKFEVQRKKVIQFSQWWKPFDWTQRLKNDD